MLTHWSQVTHIYIIELQVIVASGNGLAPVRRQAITWINVNSLSIGPSRTNFSEILFAIQTFSLNKINLKMLSPKWRPSCLSLDVLNLYYQFLMDSCHAVASASPFLFIVASLALGILFIVPNACEFTVKIMGKINYHQTSNISLTKSQNLCVSCLVFAQSIEARCYVEDEDVVGAAPTGDAPTTSEWSTVLLPKVWLILEVWQ